MAEKTVLVRPTERWLGKTQRPPRGRRIERNGRNPIEVTEQEALWLTKFFFATLVNPPECPVVPPVANKEAIATSESSPPGSSASDDSVGDIGSQDDQVDQALLLYLESTTPEQIAQDINGIGIKTANELAEARPLDIEKIDAILSDRQVRAVRAHLEAS